MSKPKVLMYVTRVSGYVLAEIRALSKMAEVYVLDRPSDISSQMHRAAPDINWVDITRFDSAEDILNSFSGWIPEIYLCAGWACSLPVKLARLLRRRGCTTIVGVDTPWRGDVRQRVHSVISWYTVRRNFEKGWGAGKIQMEHLRRLGYAPADIKEGFYSADVDRFSKIAEFEKTGAGCRFLYVGRYAPVKNMRRMEEAFLLALEKVSSKRDWELICIGTGELWGSRTIDRHIKHLGYKTPLEIQEYMCGCVCAIVPSVYEPWGVVTQEFAAAGLPILCSTAVNSGSAFVIERKNGYRFDPYSVVEISDKILMMMNKSDDEICAMKRASYEIGISYTPTKWAERLLSFRT